MSFLTTVWLTAVLLAVASATDQFHTLPSGRRIPLAVIRTHPFADKSGDHGHQLYELSNKGVLAGVAGPNVALHKVEQKASIKYSPKLTVSVNNRVVQDKPPKATVHKGKGFTAVFAEGDAHPAAIMLGDRDLAPLHFDDHPGVYIAAAGQTSNRAVHSDSSTPSDIIDTASRQGGDDGDLQEGEAEIEEGDDEMPGVPKTSGAPKTAETSGRQLLSMPISRAKLTPSVRQAIRWCGPKAAKRFYELAIAFDDTLCARYGNRYQRAVAAIQTTTISANAAFWTDTCVRMAVVHIDAHCLSRSDPYARSRGKLLENVLADFQQEWTRSYGFVKRDIALLITGYQAPERSTGISYIDSSCSNARGYGVTERVGRSGIAAAIAITIGGRVSSSTTGLLNPSAPASVIRLGPPSVVLVRNYLQSDPRSLCITAQRRFCPANCNGECVKGTCVTGSVAVAPPGPRQCTAAVLRNRPLDCLLQLKKTQFLTKWFDLLRVSAAVQYNKLFVVVQVAVGNVQVQIGVATGGDPTVFGLPPNTSNEGDTLTFRIPLSGLLVAAGQSCCGKSVHFGLRIRGCLGSDCGVERKFFFFNLRCKQVCSGGGTPLPMTDSRRCPSCRR